MKYRAKANGNIVELSEQSAAILVPNVYEKIEEDEAEEVKEPKPPKRKK